jgi:hypothetical protein
MPWLDLAGNLDFDLFGTTTPPFVDGPAARAVSFDGVDQYAKGSGTDGDDAAALKALWTFEAWIRWDDLGAPTTQDTIGYFGDPFTGGAAGDNAQFLLQVEPVSGLPTLRVGWQSGAGVWAYLNTGAIIEAGRWYHVAIRKTIVNADRGIDLFLNGVHTYSTQSGDEIVNPTGGTSANWWIGGGTVTGHNFSEVTIGPIALYSEQLTDDQIGEDFQRGMLWHVDTVIHAKVLIEDPTSAFINVDDLDGGPWLLSADWNADNDSPGDTARIMLARESGNFSLSPLVTTSKLNLSPRDENGTYDPFLAIARGVEIWTARMPVNVDPQPSDFFLEFEGKISKVAGGGSNQISLECRDLHAPIMNAYIQEDRTYSDDVGVAVETVMQSILNDNMTSAPTLQTPYTPGWLIKEFAQRREPTMTALRTLAQQIGWELKYKLNAAGTAHELTFYDVDRDAVSNGGGYFTDDQYTILPQFDVDESMIRNKVRVIFPSLEATDPGAPPVYAGLTGSAGWYGQNEKGEPLGSWVMYEDAVSIARYGERFMELAESEASQIDTLTEAARMASSGVKDLAEPDVDVAIQYVAPFPEIEVADVQTIKGDGVHATANQTLAVKAVRHTINASGAGQTTAQLRGKPSLGVSRWLGKEARPGLAAPPLHIPTGTNTGKTVRERVAAITHGVDRSLGKSNPGKRVSNQNADFGVIDRGPRFPPSHWDFVRRVGAGDGGTDWGDEIDFETATANTLSGGRAVRFNDPPSAAHAPDEIISTPMPIEDGGIVDVAVTWKLIGGGTPGPLFIQAVFYDENLTITGTGGPWVPTMNTNLLRNGFSRFVARGVQSAPGDRFVSLRLNRSLSNLGTSTDAIVDSAIVQQSAREFEAENPAPSAAIAANTWTLMRFSTENFDYGDEFDNAVNFSLDAKVEGMRALTVNAQITDGAASLITGAAIRLRDTVGGAILAQNSTTFDTDGGANFSFDLAVSGSVFVAQDANVIAEVYVDGSATAIVAAGSKFSSRLIFEE